MTEKATLTLHETARLLSCSPSTVRRMVDDGSLRAVHLRDGGAVRIPRSAVEAIVDGALTLSEAADELDIPVAEVRRLVAGGTLATVSTKQGIRVTRQAVNRLLAGEDLAAWLEGGSDAPPRRF